MRMRDVIFEHGLLVLPEPGGGPTSYDGLTELSLSMVRPLELEHVRPLGEFLSSCCPRLRKLRLRKVSSAWQSPSAWPLVLHMDLLEELEMESVDAFSKLQVVSPSLRVLDVRSWRADAVVEISAPRLETTAGPTASRSTSASCLALDASGSCLGSASTCP
ncbi:hypothetical protein BAE44_0020558 [Dichanthelium oligosanthes]|uniref:FBD domain-containing protein n=1 Tax=Dichanthelium oligosanthes TaxID=888268 RepID=A0A1E5V062_9POAL|nr:hypothetical protein BAE44_0020558 [Dichanthelium oligosanthes]